MRQKKIAEKRKKRKENLAQRSSECSYYAAVAEKCRRRRIRDRIYMQSVLVVVVVVKSSGIGLKKKKKRTIYTYLTHLRTYLPLAMCGGEQRVAAASHKTREPEGHHSESTSRRVTARGQVCVVWCGIGERPVCRPLLVINAHLCITDYTNVERAREREREEREYVQTVEVEVEVEASQPRQALHRRGVSIHGVKGGD